MGLLADHAYSLLKVVSVRTPNRGGVARLVKIRNRTPELRAQLDQGRNAGDDGTFWMAFDDFLDYFRSVEACRVRPDWAEVRVAGALPDLSANAATDGLRNGLMAYHLQVLE